MAKETSKPKKIRKPKNDKRVRYEISVWEEIERHYRMGIKAPDLSKMFGPSPAAIYKNAKRDGWVVDASEEVRVRTSNRLISKKKIPSKEDIENVAEENVSIILAHRTDIKKLREIEQKLLVELGEKPTKLYITQHKGVIVSKKCTLTVSEKAAALNQLASTMTKRITLERQARGIKDDGGEDKGLRVVLSNEDMCL